MTNRQEKPYDIAATKELRLILRNYENCWERDLFDKLIQEEFS